MAANVETMFYVREVPWHGLGVNVQEALDSKKALESAGLDWSVIQKPIYTADFVCNSGKVYTSDEQAISGYKANIRNTDNQVLGVVSDRYRVVQNHEAFEFTDTLLGEGVRYETAGSLQNGKRVWLLAKLPDKYIINGEVIEPFLVFSNSHDGSSSIRVCMSPIRVVCMNTLNFALKQAKRSWAAKHTGNVQSRMHEARETLGLAHTYMENFGKEVDNLNRIKLSDSKVMELINTLIPLTDEATATQRKNIEQQRDDIKIRYWEAPDLKVLNKNAFRFVNAVSDFATHAKPLRESSNYRENLFLKTMEGHSLIDKAHAMVKAA